MQFEFRDIFTLDSSLDDIVCDPIINLALPKSRSYCKINSIISDKKQSEVDLHRYLAHYTKIPTFVLLILLYMGYTPTRYENYFDDLVQDCSNSIANALEQLQSCTKP